MKFIGLFKKVEVMLGEYKKIFTNLKSQIFFDEATPYASLILKKEKYYQRKYFSKTKIKGASLNYLKIFGKRLTKKLKRIL